ncbi:MAG: DUF2397 domain-containing protein, partial [Actinomycetota bacterium]|nr:DUF2397 domain-containing protein [Actinomycetota bacterium]
RGAPIADLGEGRRRLAERRVAEREQLRLLIRRMHARGPLRLSTLEHVDAHEFAHLLAWIGRAYESPAGADGRRRAASSDGRITIALRQAGAQRARLCAPHGTLDLPDFHIEVLTS